MKKINFKDKYVNQSEVPFYIWFWILRNQWTIAEAAYLINDINPQEMHKHKLHETQGHHVKATYDLLKKAESTDKLPLAPSDLEKKHNHGTIIRLLREKKKYISQKLEWAYEQRSVMPINEKSCAMMLKPFYKETATLVWQQKFVPKGQLAYLLSKLTSQLDLYPEIKHLIPVSDNKIYNFLRKHPYAPEHHGAPTKEEKTEYPDVNWIVEMLYEAHLYPITNN